jgi:hypothetical protein
VRSVIGRNREGSRPSGIAQDRGPSQISLFERLVGHAIIALFIFTKPPILRCPVRWQSPHDLRVAFDRQQQGASRHIGCVLRCCSQSRKAVMGRWKASANSAWVISRRCRSHLNGRSSAHPRELPRAERLCIRVGQRCRPPRRAQSVSPHGRAFIMFAISSNSQSS